MKKKTKILIISIVGAVVLIGAVTFMLIKVLSHDKENEVKPINVSGLEVITPLTENNSAEASELIKKNIVKVINKVNDKDSIIGTGFFDKSGYLVTNSHIVDIKGDLSIEYEDGTVAVAQLFSNDITSDIALLAVENPKVKAMYFAETLSLKVTDSVYAIGYPFALQGEASVSKGILSARRSAGGIEFLQSDISLNTGNSGGPLINEKAELLGINTYATENASIGMAISSESLQSLIDKLIKEAKVNYLEDKRPENALSIVLVEIGYNTEDIYNENKLLSKEDPVYNDEGNGKNHSNNGDSKIEKKSTNYSINLIKNGKGSWTGDPLSTDILVYADLGAGLTNCRLDFSQVNIDVPGKYYIGIICDQNSANFEINIIKKPLYESAKSNVTSIDQVKDVFWYYPGYADVCLKFSVDSEGNYAWYSQAFDHYYGKVNSKIGGGSMAYSFEELTRGFKLWEEGDNLTITSNEASYTLTSIKGSDYYMSPEKDCTISPYLNQ